MFVMRYVLEKKGKNPIVIERFPGVGLVGTITTEFLIKHLDADLVGRIELEEVPPVIAVHRGEAVDPIGLFYAKKHNLLIIHALSAVSGFEWQLADLIVKLAREVKAREILSIEGIGSNLPTTETRAFYIGKSKRLKECGAEELREGIIMGVTGALLLKRNFTINCFFAETHSQLPDSRAAAKIIECMDTYLGLKVDFRPLLETATKFEQKLREMMEKAQSASTTKDSKKLTYFG